MYPLSKLLALALLPSVLPLALNQAHGAPILNSNNGHYYEAIPITSNSGIASWADARDSAASMSHSGMQGHLATLTSLDENDWVWASLGSDLTRYIFGAHQAIDGNEPAGGWSWVTGEAWAWVHWDGGEPNNGNGFYDEDTIGFTAVGKWNDLPDSEAALSGFHNYVFGYIVEYEPSASVPEPATMLLIGAGLLGFAGMRRTRQS